MTKELFINTINAIIENDKRKSSISDFIEQFIDGWAVFNRAPLEEAIDEILENEFGESGFNTIMWWLYEDVDKIIYNKDGSIYMDITNVENLYNYLVEDKK